MHLAPLDRILEHGGIVDHEGLRTLEAQGRGSAYSDPRAPGRGPWAVCREPAANEPPLGGRAARRCSAGRRGVPIFQRGRVMHNRGSFKTSGFRQRWSSNHCAASRSQRVELGTVSQPARGRWRRVGVASKSGQHPHVAHVHRLALPVTAFVATHLAGTRSSALGPARPNPTSNPAVADVPLRCMPTTATHAGEPECDLRPGESSRESYCSSRPGEGRRSPRPASRLRSTSAFMARITSGRSAMSTLRAKAAPELHTAGRCSNLRTIHRRYRRCRPDRNVGHDVRW